MPYLNVEIEALANADQAHRNAIYIAQVASSPEEQAMARRADRQAAEATQCAGSGDLAGAGQAAAATAEMLKYFDAKRIAANRGQFNPVRQYRLHGRLR